MTEAAFQGQVVELAQLHRWHVYHTFDSRRSHAGFPDLILLKGPRQLAVELKSPAGRLTPAQERWLDAFRAVRTTEAAVWRPADWSRLEAALLHGAPAAGDDG